MSGVSIARLRLRNQQIAQHDFRTPAKLVSHLGAVQAQDYAGGKWAIGLRLPNASEADIEAAIAERVIVRTWPMRGTLHFVPAADVRWMLALMASRVVAGSAGRYRSLGLDERTLERGGEALAIALAGRRSLTRPELYRALDEAGIRSADGRGLHIIAHHAQKGLVCFASHAGKQPTFVLLDEWVPPATMLDRDEALAELAKRYFTSHGPASLQDFAWWSGLPLRDVRAGAELAALHIDRMRINGVEYFIGASTPVQTRDSHSLHLLPPFDEYTVAYRDRSAAVAAEHKELASSGGVFRPIIVVDGQVVGTWKAIVKNATLEVIPTWFSPDGRLADAAARVPAKRYADFLGLPMSDHAP